MFGLDTLFAPAMIAALVVIVIVGAIAHGAIGFGFPLISTPLVALLIDIKTAVLITVLPNIAVNVISVVRGGNWGESIGKHWPMAIWVVLGTMIGTHVLLVAPPELLQLLLAAMIVAFLLQDRIRQLDLTWIRRRPAVSGAVFGTVAGLFSGAVNVSAPPLVIYFMMLELPPLALTQVLNLCFITGKTIQAATLSLAAIDRSGDRRAAARHPAAEANESRRLFQDTPCDACGVRGSVDRPGGDRIGAPAAHYLMPNLHAKIFAIVWR